MIPRVLHFVWLNFGAGGAVDVEPPVEVGGVMGAWARANPGWSVCLWSDSTALALVRDHYPWFLPTYLGYPAPIYRADAIRVLALHRHGGLYLDTDTVPGPMALDAALKGEPGLCVARVDASLHRLTNWLVGARPAHPFLGRLIEGMQARAGWACGRSFLAPLWCTGPLLYDACFVHTEGALVLRGDKLGRVCRHAGRGAWIGAGGALDVARGVILCLAIFLVIRRLG